MKKWIRLSAAAITLSLFYFMGPTKATAEEKKFPEKPIQCLVGLVAGSSVDLAARAVAKIAPKYLSKPLVVTNMAGAGQSVAMNELSKSAPDGHTIAVVTTAFKSLAAHQQKIPFDPANVKSLLGFGEFRQLLFMKGDSPYAKLDDLIAYGKKNPGWMKFSHSGRGTSIHIQGVLFFKSAKLEFSDVPFKGSAECVSSVLGGHVPAGVTEISGIKKLLDAGTLKPVVVFTSERIKELPDIPTAQERGYADVSSQNPIIYVAIHKDVPPDKVKVLHDAFKKTVEDPEFVQLAETMGLKRAYFPPRAVDEVILKAEESAVPLMRELGILAQ